MFLGWNMPNHYPPYPSYHGELLAAASIALLWASLLVGTFIVPGRAVGSASARKIGARVALPLPAIVLAVLACIPAVQHGSGLVRFRADAAFGALYGLGAAASLYAGYLWALREGRDKALRAVLSTVVAGGIVANGFALAQWLRLPASGWWAMELIENRPFANFAQPNQFGLMMVISVIGATGLFEFRAIRSRWAYWLLACYFACGVLISQSRASSIAFLFAAACWMATRKRVVTRLSMGEVVMALALWFVAYFSIDQIQELLLLGEASRKALEDPVRPAMWKHFITAILAHPWFGYGFNQGVAAMAEVATELPPSATRSTQFAHNFVLDLMVWGGIPLALLTTAGLAWGMVRWWRRLDQAESQAQRNIVFVVVFALVIQSSLEYPYAYAYFLMPVALLAGILLPFPQHFTSTGGVPRPSALAFTVAGLASALLIMAFWDYTQLEADFRAARFARANYIGRPHHEFLAEPLLLDLLAVNNQTAMRELKPGMSEEEIEQMHAIARRVQNPALQMDYAKTLALNGRMPQAQHELMILRGLYAPSVFAAINHEWQEWLNANRDRIPKPR